MDRLTIAVECEAEQAGGRAASMKDLKNLRRSYQVGKRHLKTLPPLSLWVTPVSQKNTGRTPRTKNVSTTRPASALMVGQKLIKKRKK